MNRYHEPKSNPICALCVCEAKHTQMTVHSVKNRAPVSLFLSMFYSWTAGMKWTKLKYMWIFNKNRSECVKRVEALVCLCRNLRLIWPPDILFGFGSVNIHRLRLVRLCVRCEYAFATYLSTDTAMSYNDGVPKLRTTTNSRALNIFFSLSLVCFVGLLWKRQIRRILFFGFIDSM